MSQSFSATTGAHSRSQRNCVLMVEDEMLIRMMVSDELRDENFEVIEAMSADEAMVILTSDVHIDVIVSDVRMPGSIDGIGLLKAVRKLFPTLPVIIISGHSNNDEAIATGALEFLRKPFAPEGVVNAVRKALSSPDDGRPCL